ncbi:MAG: hypothetical protein HZA08_01235 [Nitrospirae bacterium]|nr:hypothetical protein [Nitrospirota bacterium]
MKKKKILLFSIFVLLVSLWSVDSHAVTRRVGSLEFTCNGPCAPVGMVILNHLDTLRPSINFPLSSGSTGVGEFTTPWGIVIQGSVIIGDTLINITNTDNLLPLSINVKLYDKDGVIGTGCSKTLNIGANKTILLATRTWMSTCPLVIP